MNVWYDVAKNGLIGLISLDLLDRLSHSLHHNYESALHADDGSVAYFLIYQGTLPWQPINVSKMYQRRLMPLAFGALVLEKELQYHGLAVRINSAYDARRPYMV